MASSARNIVAAYPQAGMDLAREIVAVSGRLGIPDPGWLANLINFETAGTFSPSVQNPHTRATGLIQFVPPTAEGMGTSVEELATMSKLEQMDWVEAYLERKISGSRNLSQPTDLYMAVFFPVAMGQGEDFDIYDWYVENRGQSRADQYLRQNNGIRTAGDYARKANERSKLPTGLSGARLAGLGGSGTPWWAWGIALLATVALIQQVYNLKQRRRREHTRETWDRLSR